MNKQLFSPYWLLGLVLFLGYTHCLFAQTTDDQAFIRKGSIALTGSAWLNLQGSPGSTYRNGYVMPQLALYLRDNLAFTAGIGFTSEGRTYTYTRIYGEDKDKLGSWGINSSIGLTYLKWIGKRFALTGSGNLNTTIGRRYHDLLSDGARIQDRVYSGETPYWSAGISISPGLAFLLSERWLLTATFGSVQYNYTETKQFESFGPVDHLYNLKGGNSSNFYASLSSGLSLGFQYFLRRK
jgi:hypothetical protein